MEQGDARRDLQSTGAVLIDSAIERKSPALPRFITVPSSAVADWHLQGTTPVEARLNDTDIGRRNLKYWGRGRDCWFFDLTAEQCAKAGLEAGDVVQLRLTLAPTDLPSELAQLISRDRQAGRCWESMSRSHQRQLSDHVRSAKKTETRTRRARKALLGDG